MFQDATLMPWATASDNVYLPLRLRGLRRRTAAPRVAEALARVGLAGFAGRRPAELSGGMRMRVSIARALVVRAPAAPDGRALRGAGRDHAVPPERRPRVPRRRRSARRWSSSRIRWARASICRTASSSCRPAPAARRRSSPCRAGSGGRAPSGRQRPTRRSCAEAAAALRAAMGERRWGAPSDSASGTRRPRHGGHAPPPKARRKAAIRAETALRKLARHRRTVA